MFKVSVFLLCVFFSTASSAGMKWTDDYWRGKGVEVENVYLQWDNHWVQFYGSDGRSYVYYWGEQAMPDEKAKMFFSMLLTAFSANKKVSVAYETEAMSNAHHRFYFLNLHD